MTRDYVTTKKCCNASQIIYRGLLNFFLFIEICILSKRYNLVFLKKMITYIILALPIIIVRKYIYSREKIIINIKYVPNCPY